MGFFITLILFAPAAAQEDSGAPDVSVPAMRGLVERYQTDRRALQRAYSIPLSPARRDRMSRFYLHWQKRLRTVDFGSLNQDERIDYLLFGNRLAAQRRRLEHEAGRDVEIHALVPFWKLIVELEEARWRKDPVDPRKAADRLTELARRIKEGREELKGADSTKKTVAYRAARSVDGLTQALSRWYRFYDGYHPEFTWWARAPYKEASEKLREYSKFLRKDLAGVSGSEKGPLIGDPIGREALQTELAYQMIPYTPEQLIAIGRREYDWCLTEMKRAAKELGYGDDWHRALEHVKGLHVKPGEQAGLVRKLAEEAIAFLEERDLVTIPDLCKEIWRIRMMSPERQKTTPYFTGCEVVSVAFPTDAMTHEQKLMSMRGNNVHFSRATVHHELIPGHHLQGFMASRHRTHRRLFGTPFLVEGWALYWELLLWDLDFPRSPEDRIGMLFWRIHRCARIIVSLKFHLGKMTPKEMVDFLIERVGHEKDGATAEVRRYISGGYGPLYQCAYLLGGLQIRALRKELVETGKMTDREFHDAVLKQNAVPVEMIRASLTKQRLTPEFSTRWKFAGTAGWSAENDY